MANGNETMTVHVQDATGQRQCTMRDLPRDASWGEVMKVALSNLKLPKSSAGQDTIWTGRLEREGRHLHSSEVIADALQDDDRVVLQPETTAGA